MNKQQDILSMTDKESYSFRAGAERVKIEFEFKRVPDDKSKLSYVDLSPLDKESYPYIFTYTISLYEGGRFSASGREGLENYLQDMALKALVTELNMICSPWHLNDLQSGTELQTYAVKSLGDKYEYTLACDVLMSKGLFHHLGYKYGSEWLIKPLSEVVKDTIKSKLTNAILGYYSKLRDAKLAEAMKPKLTSDVTVNV
jgi:hypothetical protein